MEQIGIILGSGGAIPFSGKPACSEAIFVGNEEFVLVDAGFGIAQSLSLASLKYSNLNSIFITHYHTDHFSDLPTILFSYFLSTNKESIKIYITKENQGFLENLFFSVYGHLAATVKTVKGYQPKLELVPVTGEQLTINDCVINTLPVAHGNIECYGLSFKKNGKKLAISSDTTMCPSLISLAEGADILIQDCAFSNDFGANPLHAIPSQVAQVIRDGDVKTTLINHLMPETIGKDVKMINALQDATNRPVSLADDRQAICW